MDLLSPRAEVLRRAAPRGVDSMAQQCYQKPGSLHVLYSAVPSMLPKMSLWSKKAVWIPSTASSHTKVVGPFSPVYPLLKM